MRTRKFASEINWPLTVVAIIVCEKELDWKLEWIYDVWISFEDQKLGWTQNSGSRQRVGLNLSGKRGDRGISH